MATVITDMAVGTTVSIALATEAKHPCPFCPDPLKNGKILVTVVHQENLIASSTSHAMKEPRGYTPYFIVGYEEF